MERYVPRNHEHRVGVRRAAQFGVGDGPRKLSIDQRERPDDCARALSYNSATDSVTITPSTPLGVNQYFRIVVLGTGPTAIRDIAGNILDGAGNGAPGSNYVACFAQGTKLQYTDSSGNQVKINLNGPGYLEQIRDSSGDGELLEVVGAVSRKTTLSGSVRRVKRSSGQTQLGAITGLGSFGNIKVLMTSPPFMVKQYPFQRKGHGVL